MVSKLWIRSINKQTYKRDKNHLRAVSEISHNLIIAVVRDRLRQTLEKESWI